MSAWDSPSVTARPGGVQPWGAVQALASGDLVDRSGHRTGRGPADLPGVAALAHHLPCGVGHGHPDAQMIGHLLPVEVLGPDPRPTQFGERGGQCGTDRSGVRVQLGGNHSGGVGGWGEVFALRLGQRPDQRLDQVGTQTGNLPVEDFGRNLVEHLGRYLNGDTVAVMPGVEVVGDGHVEPADRPGPGVGVRVHLRSMLGVQLLVGEGERVEVVAAPPFPPGVEVGGGGDAGRDPGVVEGEQCVVVDHQVAAAGAVLQLFGLLDEPGVDVQEAVPRLPFPLNQRVPDEHLSCGGRVSPGQRDHPAGE